ncbi:DUF5343 domain-containing protein [Aeromicrobium fastidiosum]|uniref:DUF5343 domain-containing protein n=1 Tax=Aeromicrobium fastidiosum TaxID=52699 RepID=UPI0020232004|nr:DUF5343 domain-containing protein [Aeromicrobium fastidiosum]MCL8250541.1 DUF5343 domain-containing protein [Aeromicrobium fastidiosum]
MSGMPYVRDARDVRRVLRLVERGTMPSTVTARHLVANGIPQDDADCVRELLESLEFVTAAGVPTSVWVGYRESDDRSSVLAEALRTAFGPLLDAADDDARARVIAQVGDVRPEDVPSVLSTFTALCELSDDGTDSPVAATARQRRAVVSHISRLLQTSIAEFETARVCLQHDLTRPAIVAAWNSLAALAFAHLADDDFAILRTSGRRAGLGADELMRRVDGAELIELLVVAERVGGDDRVVLERLLAERDECAHPVPPAPDRDQTAAYLNAVLAQASQLTEHPLAHHGPGDVSDA